jgi:hypothetical protein
VAREAQRTTGSDNRRPAQTNRRAERQREFANVAPDAQQGPLEYPTAFEANPKDSIFLQSYKARLRKHLSLRKPSTLYEEVHLAVFLLATERPGEALQIVTFIGHHFEFSDDLEQWRPVAMGIALQARLLRLANHHDLARKAMQQLAAHPFVSESHEEVEHLMQKAPHQLASAFADHSTKQSCTAMARTLLTLCTFTELARYDKALQEVVAVDEIEELITEEFSNLKIRLLSS